MHISMRTLDDLRILFLSSKFFSLKLILNRIKGQNLVAIFSRLFDLYSKINYLDYLCYLLIIILFE